MTATMERPLRKSEKRVLAAIVDLMAETGRNPTAIEVSRACGVSQQFVFRVVCSLRRRGMVAVQRDGKSGLALTADWAMLARTLTSVLAALERGDDPKAIQGRHGLTPELLAALRAALAR